MIRRLPSGRMIAAARMLAGLEQQELARIAKVHPSTVSRMEAAGAETVRTHPHNLERVLQALERRGAVVTETGVELRKHRS
jgi:transcriptional regulator with XRE-family HTH domain